MKPVIRVAVMAAGVAAALGIRAWRENEQGKKVWGAATDSLDPHGQRRTSQDN